ncbi:MAG: hypothetical protein ABW136_05280 [Steroidobacteraceae bacterium]
MSTVTPAPLAARTLLAAAWPLFQVSWPSCLPLALIGVAASGSPQAAAIAAGEPRGLVHSPEWWGLYLASAALMLICQGAMLLRQHALSERSSLSVFDALRLSGRRLPLHAITAVAVVLPLAVAIALVPINGIAAAVLAVAGLLLLVWQCFAWPVALLEGASPAAALHEGAALARGRWRELLMLVATAFSGVLVFVLLAGIGLGIVMSIAGMSPHPGSMMVGFSRFLLAGVIAIPVVWLGAVWVTAYRLVRPGQP